MSFTFAKISEILSDLRPEGLEEKLRLQLVDTLKSALAKLETPDERVMEQVFVEPFYIGAIKTLQDLQLFEKWQKEGNNPKSGAQLAELVGADPTLVGRMVRYLIAMKAIDVVGPEQYKMTKYAIALGEPQKKLCFDFAHQMAYPAAAAMSPWLAESNYTNPTDAANTAFIRATPHKKDMFLWAWLNEGNDNRLEVYNNIVGFCTQNTYSWIHTFPAETLLPKAGSEGEVTLVDVGAGQGGTATEFVTKYAGKTGRVILQDRPPVVAEWKLKAPMEAMEYDFFTPQPVKGANAYFFKSIMHDWPADKAKQILLSQVPALERGKSKILLNEHVLSTDEPTPRTASYDVCMMVYGSALERTLPQWEELIAGTGLKIVKVWPGPESMEAVIELELA